MAFEALKQRQSVMWGNGPYQRVTETITDVHELVVARLSPKAGERWLDLACGTGAVSERAARAGARVVGIDLAPVLIETARARAKQQGLKIDYRVGDCEHLEGVEDATFDVVSSTCGIMFAPDHQATARELARVVQPGGRIGLANWTPDGGVGRMFGMMAPFQPSPPPSSPFDWGRKERVNELLGDAFQLEIEPHVSTLETADGEEYWQLFSTSYGPTKSLVESLPEQRREEFHRAWIDFCEGYRDGHRIAHRREYLLIKGTRR
jgi:ubiquinone/menaquinone biosynthesis C-methylase UbiE